MLTQAIAFVVEAIFDLFILSALVRFWMQVLRAPARNPLAQFTMALTDFAVKPVRRLLPGFFKLDIASIAVAWAAEVVLLSILSLLQGVEIVNGAALSVILFLALVKLLRLTVYIVMVSVLLQALLSWVNPYHPVAPFFEAMTRPFLKPFQKAIPPVGGVDITPVLVLIACQLVLMLPVAWLEGEAMRAISRFVL
jgi:YggT family protein